MADADEQKTAKEKRPGDQPRRRLSMPGSPISIGLALGSLVLIVAAIFWVFGGGGDPTVQGVAGSMPDESAVVDDAASTGAEVESDPVIEALSNGEDAPAQLD